MYKSSRYEYSSSETKRSGGGKGPQPKSYESVEPTSTVNQLDHLLDDLKHERNYSFDKGKLRDTQFQGIRWFSKTISFSSNIFHTDAGIDPGLL